MNVSITHSLWQRSLSARKHGASMSWWFPGMRFLRLLDVFSFSCGNDHGTGVNNFCGRGLEHSPDLRDWLPACHGSWVTRVFATRGSPSLGKRGESRNPRQSGGPSFEAHSYLTRTFYCCNRVQIARKSLIPLGFDLKGGISADMFARKAAKE